MHSATAISDFLFGPVAVWCLIWQQIGFINVCSQTLVVQDYFQYYIVQCFSPKNTGQVKQTHWHFSVFWHYGRLNRLQITRFQHVWWGRISPWQIKSLLSTVKQDAPSIHVQFVFDNKLQTNHSCKNTSSTTSASSHWFIAWVCFGISQSLKKQAESAHNDGWSRINVLLLWCFSKCCSTLSIEWNSFSDRTIQLKLTWFIKIKKWHTTHTYVFNNLSTRTRKTHDKNWTVGIWMTQTVYL